MNIEIVGSESSNKMKLEKNLKKALNSVKLRVETNIRKIDDNKKLNIREYPAFVINSNVISEGKVLTDKEIAKYLKQYAVSSI